ncbi:hypothetical protein FSARC_4672, partial [Fusarium sarcochroum]
TATQSCATTASYETPEQLQEQFKIIKEMGNQMNAKKGPSLWERFLKGSG